LIGFAGITDLLGVLEHSKFALNVAFFVRHRYFLHPKSGNLSKVSQESLHIYINHQLIQTLGLIRLLQHAHRLASYLHPFATRKVE
jgi:hypothetical protein